jgi:DNA-binding MarR family transcriptional regulator
MDQTEREERLLASLRLLVGCEEGRSCMAASRGELCLLMHLKRQNDPVLPSELSEAMSVSTARITRLLNTLEERNLIQRSIDVTDRRKIIVELTEAGDRYLEAVYARTHRRASAVIEALGAEDTEAFIRIAERIADISRALSADETEEQE